MMRTRAILALLLVFSTTPLVAQTYYFAGEPADQANKVVLDVGTATFNQTPPTGTVPITQTGTPFANDDFVGNFLAMYWTGPFTGQAVGTLDFQWYWSSTVAAAIGGFVDISVFADPDFNAPSRVQPQRLIGRALVQLVGIGVAPTLIHSQIPINGSVTRELVIQAVPHFIVNDTELLVHYGAVSTPSSFSIITGPARVPFPAASQAVGLPPRYKALTPTPAQLAAGQGIDAGEPSIGSNWISGNAMFISILQTFRVIFDDSCATTPASTWLNKTAPNTSQISFDPILYTDSKTGRTIVSQLLLNPIASASSFTDDDGENWTPSQGAGFGSGVDHQTVGGGPFHAPIPSGATYPNAVYYCSQDVALANCAISLNGGLTYGPAVPIYDATQCGGLHGHIKVGPDGTVYVPNKGCAGEEAVVVSENNGVTWDIRKVKGSLPSDSDPSVAISRGGRVYFGFADNDNNMVVAVSDDRGKNWYNIKDVGALAGLNNVVFPAVVAGDDLRAAVAYLGTTTKGALEAREFPGVWYGFISTTYDGGVTWHTVNATPNDPVQRGPIWLSGGSEISRNLLDFNDLTIDKQGRVLFAYADGCVEGCLQTGDSARGNSYSARASILRQSGGRRMFLEDDPAEPTVPGAPTLTVTRNGALAKLTWSEANDGGSPVTNYAVYRSDKLIANTTASSYTDASGDASTTYTYRVVATNRFGSSCGSNTVSSAPVGSSCTAPGITLVTDATGDQAGAPGNAALDIQSVSISEPFFADGSQKIVFTIKVANLASLPALSEWRVFWNFPIGASGQFFADMRTNSSGAVSFPFGRIAVTGAVVTSVGQPVTLGNADPESSFSPDGTIRIVLPTIKLTTDATKFPGPVPGDIIGGLVARTYTETGAVVTSGRVATDVTRVGNPYVLVGNAFCTPPVITCIEDDDPRIAFSNGWHLLNDPNASAGHFRLGSGNATASLTFTVPANQFGAITYYYATAPKGGTAEVFIDGVSEGVISFSGATGTTKNPQFGASRRFGGLQPGTHTFEIRGNGKSYLDKLCLESSSSNASPTSGPGTTSTKTSPLTVGAQTISELTLPANATAVSVIAEEKGDLPVQLVLIDPLGVTLGTADNSNGLAVINRPVTGGGIYLVKTINLSVGPVEVWTASTPLVNR
jgi:hypothetical protein